MNLAEDLERSAARYPDKPAVVAPSETLSYRALDERASRIAEALARLGVGAGDRVAVMLPSTPAHVAVFYGIEKLGALHVGTHLQLTPNEVEYQLRNAGAKAIVVAPPFEKLVVDLATSLPSLEHILVSGRAGSGAQDLDELMTAESGTTRAVELGADASAMIFYTSGTTGVPKGVVHTHEGISVLLDALSRRYSVTPEDSHIIALPLFLLAILVQGPALCVRNGGTLYLLERYDPLTVGRLITEHGITFSGATIPTMFIDLANLPERDAADIDLSSLRVALCGGSPMAERLRNRFEQRYGMRIVFGFGGTEGPGGVTADPVDGERRAGSVGIPMDHVHLRVVDEHDEDLPVGDIGEIVTGPRPDGPFAGVYRPMKEYWGMPEATREALRGGYLHWGDLGRLDEDGYVYIVDRLKDMIIRAGMNIYPAELEKLILADERVEACAVVGIPADDERLGEVPKAFVELRAEATATEQEIKDLVARQSAKYKHLHAVEFIDQLPKNALGKILKRELRKR